MRHLLQNLIGNALKFHRPEVSPRVKVWSRLMREDGDDAETWFEILVDDNGVGFDEKYLSRLFKPFERLHGRGEFEGNGMGLAICRNIAERHRGRITARSRVGQGTTFIVTIPAVHQKSPPRRDSGLNPAVG